MGDYEKLMKALEGAKRGPDGAVTQPHVQVMDSQPVPYGCMAALILAGSMMFGRWGPVTIAATAFEKVDRDAPPTDDMQERAGKLPKGVAIICEHFWMMLMPDQARALAENLPKGGDVGEARKALLRCATEAEWIGA